MVTTLDVRPTYLAIRRLGRGRYRGIARNARGQLTVWSTATTRLAALTWLASIETWNEKPRK